MLAAFEFVMGSFESLKFVLQKLEGIGMVRHSVIHLKSHLCIF